MSSLEWSSISSRKLMTSRIRVKPCQSRRLAVSSLIMGSPVGIENRSTSLVVPYLFRTVVCWEHKGNPLHRLAFGVASCKVEHTEPCGNLRRRPFWSPYMEPKYCGSDA